MGKESSVKNRISPIRRALLPVLLSGAMLVGTGCRTDASGPRIVEPVPVATDVAENVIEPIASDPEAVVIGLQADVQLDASRYLEGAPIEVTVISAELGPRAWIGIFELEAHEVSEQGTALLLQTEVQAGSYTLEAPTGPGRYQVCLIDPDQETGLLAYREFEVEPVPESTTDETLPPGP